uniref:DNA polymerase n=1 Tax=Elmerina hispida TaxID=1245649 RepID=UPI003002D49D|nr:DNA polymerase [Elmerina hispida]
MFNLNITNYPTLPSLTFAIFRSNYLKDIEKKGFYIPLIKGKMYNDIKYSYTGGSTDMFIPQNPEGSKVYAFDVNSLYPTTMSKGMFMPVVSAEKNYVEFFEGDISLIDQNKEKKAFGFFKVNVETTKDLEHPILQLKTDTSPYGGSGIRTISPLGKWNYTYFSEEISNAVSEKNGYKVDIISGYLFNKFDIFSEFIDELYKIKEAHDKNDPWYAIAKLLMNSLYGRFGMDPNFENHSFIEDLDLDKFLNKFDVLDIKSLDNNILLISYIDKEDIEKSLFSDQTFSGFKSKNVSISIASAITAYARIFMSKFKNDPNIKIYYTDTDSLYIDKPLEEKFIGKKLGQFKLEHVFNKFVALAPKVYGGITEDGLEITKVKGLKNKVQFKDLVELLKKDETLNIKHEK